MTGSSLIAFAQCETTALLTCVPVVQNNMGKGENESNGTFVESTLFESDRDCSVNNNAIDSIINTLHFKKNFHLSYIKMMPSIRIILK